MGFLVVTAQDSWELGFFSRPLILWVPLISGQRFSLATHNINTKISGLPDVLGDVLFVKYFKDLQMRRNLYCCILLTINQQELFYN